MRIKNAAFKGFLTAKFIQKPPSEKLKFVENKGLLRKVLFESRFH